MIKLAVILCLVAASQAHAAVYKCTNAQGKMEYSDKPCADGVKMRVDVSPDVNVVPRVANPHARSEQPEALGAPAQPSSARARAAPSAPTKCSFSYYTYGDDKGELLAENAKQECLRNNSLKAAGRDSEVSLEHYTYWKDHRQLKMQDRNAAIARDAAAQAAAAATYDKPKIDLKCRPDGFGNLNCRN